MKKVTQADIAKELNISRTTVARALNDSGPIDEETKRLVLEKAEEMGYKTNPLAKSLARKKRLCIQAFLVKSYNQYVDNKLKQGLKTAEDEFEHFDINIKLNAIEAKKPDKQIKVIRETLKKDEQLDGLIIMPLAADKIQKEINNYIDEQLPIVTLNMDFPNNNRLLYVGPNYYKEGRIAGEMLAKYIGSKGKIAIFSSEFHYQSIDERMRGFKDKINQFEQIQIVGEFSTYYIEELYNLAKEVISKYPDLAGIYGVSESTNLAKALCDMEKKEITLVGNDLSDLIKKYIKNNYIEVSIHQRAFLQGYLAGRYLAHYLVDSTKPDEEEIITGFDIVCQENLDVEENLEKMFKIKKNI